jgi:uncharacterized protein YmfQ (DUF2313 family)
MPGSIYWPLAPPETPEQTSPAIAFTHASYVRQLRNLLPPGVAFDELQPELKKMLAALAEELARVDARGIDLINEADPRTADETIADWERVLSLPDEQVPVIAGTLAERRIAVTQKYTARGGQNVAFFVALAAACGYTVEDVTLATPTISSVTSNGAGGTLGAGTYSYRVSAVSAYGETLASAAVSVVIGAGATNRAIVNWGAVDGATHYRIFGRTAGAELCIGRVAAGTLTFSDTGAVTPGDVLPAGPNPLAYRGIEKFGGTVARVGSARCGASRLSKPWAYAMLVNAQTPGGPALTQDQFEAVIRHHTHAHITVVFEYHP